MITQSLNRLNDVTLSLNAKHVGDNGADYSLAVDERSKTSLQQTSVFDKVYLALTEIETQRE